MTDSSKFLNKIEEELFSKFLLLRDIIYLEITKHNEMVKIIEKLPFKNSYKNNKKNVIQNLFVIPDIKEEEIEEAKEYIHMNLTDLIMKRSETIREYCELDNISDEELSKFIKSYIVKTSVVDTVLYITVSI